MPTTRYFEQAMQGGWASAGNPRGLRTLGAATGVPRSAGGLREEEGGIAACAKPWSSRLVGFDDFVGLLALDIIARRAASSAGASGRLPPATSAAAARVLRAGAATSMNVRGGRALDCSRPACPSRQMLPKMLNRCTNVAVARFTDACLVFEFFEVRISATPPPNACGTVQPQAPIQLSL